MTSTESKLVLEWDPHEEQDEFSWGEMTTALAEIMDKINPDEKKWACQVRNFGWRGQNGHKIFYAHTPDNFLREILPETENHFKIYVDYEAKQITINNAHHDSPSWNEFYYIVTANECYQCGEVLTVVDEFGDFEIDDSAEEVDDGLLCSACIKMGYR